MTKHLHLFEGFGIELEYMIVDQKTLQVRPMADELFKAEAGTIVSDVTDGAIEWSNELALHVVEIKTNGPAKTLKNLDQEFHRSVQKINRHLNSQGAMLLPTAMHPLMNPEADSKLWPHDNAEIYSTYDRIFNCKGHGWFNLQSMHINYPFYNEEEFSRLHAAIRFILPLLPALSASSPLREGKTTGFLDTRLETYRTNQIRVPSIVGDVVPEPAFTYADYKSMILDRIQKDIAPLDPDHLLRDDWLNSRGAIARFGRQTIEIRILDLQESPSQDIAIAEFTTAILKLLIDESMLSLAHQKSLATADLKSVYDLTVRHGRNAKLPQNQYTEILQSLLSSHSGSLVDKTAPPATHASDSQVIERTHTSGVRKSAAATSGEVLQSLLALCQFKNQFEASVHSTIAAILKNGSLSERILQSHSAPNPDQIRATYSQIAQALVKNKSWNLV